MNSAFLWPEPKALATTDLLGLPCPSEAIETKLQALYPAADAVLFSSARAGLTAVLQSMGLSRPDLCWTPGFSSHCVLEAVAHVCTPTPVVAEQVKAALVYHQWGFVHQSAFASSVRIIEDAVDALLMPGATPFAAGGDSVLWSLPKVLGTQGGGVVFCRTAELGIALRAIRDERSCSMLQSTLRHLAKSSARASAYWNGAEAMQGELPQPHRRQVARALDSIDQLVANRLDILNDISTKWTMRVEASRRLPSNLPLRVPQEWQRIWGTGGGVSSGLRSFNESRSCPDTRWVKVAPLPVHADIGRRQLTDILSGLDIKDSANELEIV